MKRFLFAPTISWFQYATIVIAIGAAHLASPSPWSVLVWLGVIVAGAVIDACAGLEASNG